MFQNMSFDQDVCSTHLHLGLSLDGQKMAENDSEFDFHGKKPCLKSDILSSSFEPSLTLGLPDEIYVAKEESRDMHLQTSSQSDVSSFSNTKIKRERELGSEEMMCRKVVSDEDEEGNARKKLRLTKGQAALLEDSFKENTTLNPRQKLALAKQLNLRPRQVEVWFQNRRARTKLKQTEVDCEYLKKCCEALTHENKRLQKELHELKAMKVTPQLYMHLPAATLTMCPSCERIGGGNIINNNNNNNNNNNTSSKASYTVAKEPHSHNSFNQSSSAAC